MRFVSGVLPLPILFFVNRVTNPVLFHYRQTWYGEEVARDAGAGTLEEAHHDLFKISPEVCRAFRTLKSLFLLIVIIAFRSA